MMRSAAEAGGAGGAAAGAPQGGGFFSNLFEVFTPRQQCMNYENDVVWLHIVSDAMIAAAYFSIPLALLYFVRRRKDLAFNWMFLLFAAFILACGTTHVFGVVAIWKPYYRVDGLVKLFTGLVSIATAVLLWPLVNKALLLPSPAQLRLANEDLHAQVAERQRAEAETRRAKEQLEQRVLERTAELHAVSEERAGLLHRERAARAEAERSSRVKDDFVATLSHELRTPLSAIMGWTYLLRANPRRPDAGYGLEVIERNTRAQARMIDDLLDMSRIVSGKLRIDAAPVDLSQVIDAAMETVRPAADAKGVRLERRLDPAAGGAKALGDAARLQQVVWNLLTNAIKFTPRSGRVVVSLASDGPNVQVVVQDTGQGIKGEFLPHVFDRFRQQDASTTRTHSGLGIGLSIVRHLVEMHGGTVQAFSAGEGAGARFTVTIPGLTDAQAARIGGSEPARAEDVSASMASIGGSPSLAGVRVLVIDDEADARDLSRRILEGSGASVQTAASVAEALELLSRSPVDLLVCDIGMPDEDGYAFIRKVRQAPGGAGAPGRLPAVALTAFARVEDRTRALLSGFQAHIAKPTDPAELLATAASLTGRT
jgi:signal transduction histidine kinase/CheY-like chemotaxis protein